MYQSVSVLDSETPRHTFALCRYTLSTSLLSTVLIVIDDENAPMNDKMIASQFSTLLMILSVVAVQPAHAETAKSAAPGVQSYPSTYFTNYNPQTARDMVDRLPGFKLDTGADLRGFGSGAGNVLINGARPSSKAGGVEDALARIAAGSVVRIEVIRGTAGASETAGQAVVANVVTGQGETTSRWELQLERADHGKLNAAGEWVSSRTLGNWDTSTKLNAIVERKPLAGSRTSRDSSDVITANVLENSPNSARQFAISSQARSTARGGLLTVNGRISHTPRRTETERFGFNGSDTQGIADQRQFIDFDRTTTDAEIGIDWTRALSQDWSIKWLSLSSFEDYDSRSLTFLQRPLATDVSNSQFDNEQESLETVARVTLNRNGQSALRPEFGGEIAYNRLDSNLALRFEDANGPVNVALPAANVRVEEIRGELFANLVWGVSDSLAVETGLGAELSKIRVSGDAKNTQSFFFAKPFATLIYDPKDGVQLRLGARRSVGQLDFTDFAASASADDDILLGGNPNLGPDQTTRLSASIDLRSQVRGAINVELFHEWRDDVLELIILPSGAQGLGNAGSAKVWGAKSTVSLPLSSFIPGGLLELEAEWRDSSFDDSIIGRERSISSIDRLNAFVEFRQDLSKQQIAWGFSYQAPLEGPFFFVDEISLNRDGRAWKAFIETTRYFGLKTSLVLEGIGKRNFSRERQFFDPDRRGVIQRSQFISRDRGMFVTLTASGQF